MPTLEDKRAYHGREATVIADQEKVIDKIRPVVMRNGKQNTPEIIAIAVAKKTDYLVAVEYLSHWLDISRKRQVMRDYRLFLMPPCVRAFIIRLLDNKNSDWKIVLTGTVWKRHKGEWMTTEL